MKNLSQNSVERIVGKSFISIYTMGEYNKESKNYQFTLPQFAKQQHKRKKQHSKKNKTTQSTHFNSARISRQAKNEETHTNTKQHNNTFLDTDTHTRKTFGKCNFHSTIGFLRVCVFVNGYFFLLTFATFKLTNIELTHKLPNLTNQEKTSVVTFECLWNKYTLNEEQSKTSRVRFDDLSVKYRSLDGFLLHVCCWIGICCQTSFKETNER